MPEPHHAFHGSPAYLRLSLVSLALTFVLFACEKAPPEVKEVIRPIKMQRVQGQADLKSEFPGKVAAKISSQMGFEVPGRIIALPVKEGQVLKKGEIIAKIDPRDYEARLASERAKLREAKLNYDRAKQLYASQSIALAELDAERRKFEVVQASFREAMKAKEETIIRAPFDGVVAKKLIKEFTNVAAKQTVVIFQDESGGLEIDINVPETSMANPGRKGLRDVIATMNPQVEVAAFPDKRFAATVKEVANVADPVTRTFKVTFAFDRPANLNIFPGMSAKVIFEVKSDSAALERKSVNDTRQGGRDGTRQIRRSYGSSIQMA